MGFKIQNNRSRKREPMSEINVTSPTGIQEINRLNGARLEKFFWDRVEKKLR